MTLYLGHNHIEWIVRMNISHISRSVPICSGLVCVGVMNIIDLNEKKFEECMSLRYSAYITVTEDKN